MDDGGGRAHLRRAVWPRHADGILAGSHVDAGHDARHAPGAGRAAGPPPQRLARRSAGPLSARGAHRPARDAERQSALALLRLGDHVGVLSSRALGLLALDGRRGAGARPGAARARRAAVARRRGRTSTATASSNTTRGRATASSTRGGRTRATRSSTRTEAPSSRRLPPAKSRRSSTWPSSISASCCGDSASAARPGGCSRRRAGCDGDSTRRSGSSRHSSWRWRWTRRSGPVTTIGSNAGHCLAAGIVRREHVRAVADRLFEPDLFSGWGIRTLSSAHPAFNPYSYHRGSVWPVEQGSFALGLVRYGLLRPPRSARARPSLTPPPIFEHGRLPELFSGHPRNADHPFPALYPQANAPQAWSASTVFLLMQSMLGLYPYAPSNLLFLDPHLPRWLPALTVRNLQVGQRGRDDRVPPRPPGDDLQGPGTARHAARHPSGEPVVAHRAARPPATSAGREPAKVLVEVTARVLLAVALLGACVLGYRYWAGDERQIRRLLDNVADASARPRARPESPGSPRSRASPTI